MSLTGLPRDTCCQSTSLATLDSVDTSSYCGLHPATCCCYLCPVTMLAARQSPCTRLSSLLGLGRHMASSTDRAWYRY